MIEMLSAIPSVIYGLWAIFIMLPWLSQNVFPLFRHTIGKAAARRPIRLAAITSPRPRDLVQRPDRRGLQHALRRAHHRGDDPADHHERFA